MVRVWVQRGCRANSQSGKHYPWKPTCLWRDASRWTSSRLCVPFICPSRFAERCCSCTCYRKYGRWRPETLEGLNIIQLSSSQEPTIFWLPHQKIVEATLWSRKGLREKAWNGREGDRAQISKNDIAQGHNINRLKSNGSKMANKSNSTKPWSSTCKLNDTSKSAMTVPRHYQKSRWLVPQLLEWSSHSLAYEIQFTSVQLPTPVQLFVTPWTAAWQASLSITSSWSLPKLMSIESVMASNHLILCPLLLPPSIFPSIRVFSNASVL